MMVTEVLALSLFVNLYVCVCYLSNCVFMFYASSYGYCVWMDHHLRSTKTAVQERVEDKRMGRWHTTQVTWEGV